MGVSNEKMCKILSKDNINIKNEDFITYNDTTKYDLVIGNPPYFVMKKKDVAKDYYDYFDERPNIFILFLIKCLKSIIIMIVIHK
jgi:type I restriction-modification system DNA methylase subunit